MFRDLAEGTRMPGCLAFSKVRTENIASGITGARRRYCFFSRIKRAFHTFALSAVSNEIRNVCVLRLCL